MSVECRPSEWQSVTAELGAELGAGKLGRTLRE